MKNIFINFLIIITSTLTALCATEAALRILWSRIQPQTYTVSAKSDEIRPDPILQIVDVPGSQNGAIDKNGFANSDVRDTYDIVVLGDSHTAGTMNNWPKELASSTGKSIYNMGIHGYGPAQYFYLLDKALSFHPKTVIVGFYMGNDIFNAYDVVYHLDYWKSYRDPNFVDDHPALADSLKATHIPLRTLRDWFRDKSYLYRLLGDRTRIWREEVGLATPRNIGTMDWSDNDPDVSLRYDEKPAQKTLFWVGSRFNGVNLADKNLKEGLRQTQLFLSAMQKKANDAHANLVIAFIPSKDSAYEDLAAKQIVHSPTYIKVLKYESEILSTLKGQCEKEKMMCVDLLPYLKDQLQQGAPLYKQNWDEHPASIGYKAYADGIHAYLQAMRLL